MSRISTRNGRSARNTIFRLGGIRAHRIIITAVAAAALVDTSSICRAVWWMTELTTSCDGAVMPEKSARGVKASAMPRDCSGPDSSALYASVVRGRWRCVSSGSAASIHPWSTAASPARRATSRSRPATPWSAPGSSGITAMRAKRGSL
eukprot:gene1782-biopygen1326